MSYCHFVVFFSCPSLCYYRLFKEGDKNRPSAGLRTCGSCKNCWFRPPLETQQTKPSSLGTWQLHNPAPEWLRLHVSLSTWLDKLSPIDKKWHIWDSECHLSRSVTDYAVVYKWWLGSQGCQWVQLSLSCSVVASVLYTMWIRCHKDAEMCCGCYYGQLWHNTNIMHWFTVLTFQMLFNTKGCRRWGFVSLNHWTIWFKVF